MRNIKANKEAKKAVKSADTLKLNVTNFADKKKQIKELIQIKCQIYWSTEHQIKNNLKLHHLMANLPYKQMKKNNNKYTTHGTHTFNTWVNHGKWRKTNVHYFWYWTINHIFTECLQYTDELNNLNIPNT